MTQKIESTLFFIPIAVAFIIFCFIPTWQSSALVLGAFSFAGFLKFNEGRKVDEMDAVRGEIKFMKDRIEAIQLGRSIGR